MKLLRLLPWILLATAVASAVFGQSSPRPLVASVPDHILYDVFFFRVTWFDQMAQQRDSSGKDGSSLHSAIRRQAGLRMDEEQALKAVAVDCREKITAILAATRAAALAGSKSDTQAAANQRRQVVLDHIGQLRARFSPASFLRLDAYVRLTVKVQTPAMPRK